MIISFFHSPFCDVLKMCMIFTDDELLGGAS